MTGAFSPVVENVWKQVSAFGEKVIFQSPMVIRGPGDLVLTDTALTID